MKFIITFALLYLAYRYFFGPQNALQDQDESPKIKQKERGVADEDEYVDYEEVE